MVLDLSQGAPGRSRRGGARDHAKAEWDVLTSGHAALTASTAQPLPPWSGVIVCLAMVKPAGLKAVCEPKMQAIKMELRKKMHDPIAKTGVWIKQVPQAVHAGICAEPSSLVRCRLLGE
jgi:hypothetical protein